MTSPPKITDSDIAYYLDEELETLFHSDLQDLQLEHDEAAQDDVLAGHLPEWLIGIIVVVIMLILVFFVMIVRSVMRNRKSNRPSSETALNAFHADDLESGKVGHGEESGLQVTSFTSLPAGGDNSGSSQLPYLGSDLSNSMADTLSNRGCRNPLFMDEGEDLHNDNSKNNENVRESNTFNTSFHNSDADMNLKTDCLNSGSKCFSAENKSLESGSFTGASNKHKYHNVKKSDGAKQTTVNVRNCETETGELLNKKLESDMSKVMPPRSYKHERTKSLGGSCERTGMDTPRNISREKQKRQVFKGREDENAVRDTALNSIPEDNIGETTLAAMRPDSGLSSQSDVSKIQDDESEDCSDKDAEARAVLDAILGGENTEDESLSESSYTSEATNEAKEGDSGALQSENQRDENATIPVNCGTSETNLSSSSILDEEVSCLKMSKNSGCTFSNFDMTEDNCEHVTGKLASPFNVSTTEQTKSMSLSQEVFNGVRTDIKDSLDSGESCANNVKCGRSDQLENDSLHIGEGIIRNDSNVRNSTKL